MLCRHPGLDGGSGEDLKPPLFYLSSLTLANSDYTVVLIASKALDASRRSRSERGRRGATTEAYGVTRLKKERSKATPLARSPLGGEMMP